MPPLRCASAASAGARRSRRWRIPTLASPAASGGPWCAAASGGDSCASSMTCNVRAWWLSPLPSVGRGLLERAMLTMRRWIVTMGTREQLDRHEIRVLRLIGQTPSDTFSEAIAPWVMELILEVCAGGPPDRAIQTAWPRLLGIVRNE